MPYLEERKITQAADVLRTPYIIITQINNVIYHIEQHPSAKMIVIHLDGLTPYLGATKDK